MDQHTSWRSSRERTYVSLVGFLIFWFVFFFFSPRFRLFVWTFFFSIWTSIEFHWIEISKIIISCVFFFFLTREVAALLRKKFSFTATPDGKTVGEQRQLEHIRSVFDSIEPQRPNPQEISLKSFGMTFILLLFYVHSCLYVFSCLFLFFWFVSRHISQGKGIKIKNTSIFGRKIKRNFKGWKNSNIRNFL